MAQLCSDEKINSSFALSNHFTGPHCTLSLAPRSHRLNRTMGGTISTRVVFGQNGVDFSKTNELIVNELAVNIEALAQNNPREAEIVFHKPIAWLTALSASDFNDSAFTVEGFAVPLTLQCNRSFYIRASVKSTEKKQDGSPLMLLEKGIISVTNFAYLAKVLIAAKANKITEIRNALSCLYARYVQPLSLKHHS